MTKRIVALVVFCFLAVSGNVLAQNTQSAGSAQIERYYKGIGVQLFWVNKGVSSYYAGGKKYDNSSGVLTGLVVFDRVLENGPAHRASIREGDVLVEISNQTVSNLSVNEVISLLTGDYSSRADIMRLRIRRIDTHGNSQGEFNILVIQKAIDRADWVHYDLPLGGGFGSEKGVVRYNSEVSRDNVTGKFTYRYEVFNNTSASVILKSTIFNLLLRKDNSDTDHYYLKLDPAKTVSFVLESDSFPFESVSSAISSFTDANSDPEKLKYFKENFPDLDTVSYVSSTGRRWLHDMGTSMYLFVPEKWLATLLEENERFWRRPQEK